MVRIRRKKTIASVTIVVGGLVGLWIAGPEPLETAGYVQAVTMHSATICKVDAAPRRLATRVWLGSGIDSGIDSGITVAEDLPVAVHGIRVDGLQPGAPYRYEVREGDVVVAKGRFRTAPRGDSVPVRFAAVGDSGQLPWWYNMHEIGWSRIRPLLAWTQRTEQWDIAEWIAAADPHFFIHLGDIVYWRKLWDAHGEAFFRPFGPVLAGAVLFTLVGNHDIPEDGSEPPFQRLFHNPAAGPGVGRPRRNYTFAWGAVRVVGLDVTDPQWRVGATRKWLEQTLSEATEPWIVVATHTPCFSVYRDERPELRDELWSLLTEYGVDLVFSGDDHHFARFARTSPDSPIQVIVGGGGKKLYDFNAKDERLAASAKAWSFLSVEVEGLRLKCAVVGRAKEPVDAWVIDRTRGPLPRGVSAQRRARILRLRR